MQKRNKSSFMLWVSIALATIILIGIIVVATTSDNANRESELTKTETISHAHGLAVDIENPDKLYIATHFGLLLLEDDQTLYKIGESRDDFMGFSTHPTNPDTFFASGHLASGGNLGLQKTVDGGVTWQNVSDDLNGPVDFHAMAVGQTDAAKIYGYYGGLQRSLDGGNNWQIPNADLPDIIDLATDPSDANTVYATTPEGLYVSTDQGETWDVRAFEGEVVMTIAINPTNNQEMIAYTRSSGLLQSADGGQIWRQLDIATTSPIMYIDYAKTKPGTVYALNQANEIYKSTNGGGTWQHVY